MVPFRRFFTELSDNMYFIGGALIVTGILLLRATACAMAARRKRPPRCSTRCLSVSVRPSALCPGISRSGMTITAGCFTGFERKFAVRFAFLLSIPAVLGANILTLKDAIDAGIDFSSVPVYLVGVVVAAVSGYASIRLLRYVADKGRFGAFAYYCWPPRADAGAHDPALIFDSEVNHGTTEEKKPPQRKRKRRVRPAPRLPASARRRRIKSAPSAARSRARSCWCWRCAWASAISSRRVAARSAGEAVPVALWLGAITFVAPALLLGSYILLFHRGRTSRPALSARRCCGRVRRDHAHRLCKVGSMSYMDGN